MDELNRKLAEWAGLCWHEWEWKEFERWWEADDRAWRKDGIVRAEVKHK